MTKSDGPRPKLRVTFRRRTPGCPHDAQSVSGAIGGDDEKIAERPDFDDGFGVLFLECETTYDALDFPCSDVSLALNDFACEDNVFEVKDREVVIV